MWSNVFLWGPADTHFKTPGYQKLNNGTQVQRAAAMETNKQTG